VKRIIECTERDKLILLLGAFLQNFVNFMRDNGIELRELSSVQEFSKLLP